MEQPRLNEVSAEKLREKLTDLFGSEELRSKISKEERIIS